MGHSVLEEVIERCYPELVVSDAEKWNALKQTVRPFVLDADTVRRVRNTFRMEIELGLQRNPERSSSLQMNVAHVPQLPDGTETGDVLALDLGGTNFRVLHLHLGPETSSEYHVKHYAVPEVVRKSSGEELFDFLADCLRDFAEASGLTGRRLPLGFCFSFPIVQKTLDSGVLIEWTVSYDCPGVVGQDVGRMLRDAIRRRTDLDMNLIAIVNDTVGTLVQGAFLDSDCAIGLIMGTGNNACYLEKAENISKLCVEGQEPRTSEVIVNTEWGAFGDNGLLDFVKTKFDRAVDEQSLFPGSFTFEKLLSGEFLGEIVRQVLAELVRQQVLFNDEGALTNLKKPGSFTAVDVSQFLQADGADSRRSMHEVAARILGCAERIIGDDIAIIKHVCGVISARAALLVSICLAELLKRVGRTTSVTIAVDGSLYKHHPTLKTLMGQFISALAPERPFKLMLAEDGSGKGAGLVAAVVERLRSAMKNGSR